MPDLICIVLFTNCKNHRQRENSHCGVGVQCGAVDCWLHLGQLDCFW